MLAVKDKGRHEVVIVEGAMHELAIRGPLEEEQAEVAEIAEDQAVRRFERWLVKTDG